MTNKRVWGSTRRWAIAMRCPRLIKPNALGIVWAAAIYEGEGCCIFSKLRKNLAVSICQQDQEILFKLKFLFGGGVSKRYSGGTTSNWQLSGIRAHGFLMTIYKFLSERRKEEVKSACLRETNHFLYQEDCWKKKQRVS